MGSKSFVCVCCMAFLWQATALADDYPNSLEIAAVANPIWVSPNNDGLQEEAQVAVDYEFLGTIKKNSLLWAFSDLGSSEFEHTILALPEVKKHDTQPNTINWSFGYAPVMAEDGEYNLQFGGIIVRELKEKGDSLRELAAQILHRALLFAYNDDHNHDHHKQELEIKLKVEPKHNKANKTEIKIKFHHKKHAENQFYAQNATLIAAVETELQGYQNKSEIKLKSKLYISYEQTTTITVNIDRQAPSISFVTPQTETVWNTDPLYVETNVSIDTATLDAHLYQGGLNVDITPYLTLNNGVIQGFVPWGALGIVDGIMSLDMNIQDYAGNTTSVSILIARDTESP